MINLTDILGLRKAEFMSSVTCDNVVAENRVNGTIEIKGIKTPYSDYNNCHAIFYFDLSGSTRMNMVMVKVEGATILQYSKLMRLRNVKHNEYVMSVTPTGGRTVLLTYILSSIVQNI